MDCDLLLTWMTHAGEGSWTSFRRCVDELAPTESESSETLRALRVSFSDLGYAEFFVNGSRTWKVLAPQLCGSAAGLGSAVLCGARTQGLIDAVLAAAETYGCRIECSEAGPHLPHRIAVMGPDERIAALGTSVNVPYRPKGAAALLQSLESIFVQMNCAAEEPAPRNWKVRSFDLQTLRWVDGLLPRSSCEFTPRFGSPKYFLNRKRRPLLAMQKRESVYASALLSGVRLVSYDQATQALTVPLSAPLPEKLARAACLCSGRPAEVVDGRLLYQEVPLDIAAALFAVLGDPQPMCGHPLLVGKRADG